MSKLGGGRMPRAGSSVVDDRATRMIHDWIAGMPAVKGVETADSGAKLPAEDRAALGKLRSAPGSDPTVRSAAIGRLLSSTRGGLSLLALIDRGEVSERGRGEIIAFARAASSAEVRDLFERFIPESERTKRLGDVIDRATLLAMRGDLVRGREIFSNNAAAQCKSCHKVGDMGQAVGPDLTKIGAKYNKAMLLDQILEPSKTIEPAYTTYLIETKDGQLVSGLAMERNKDSVVLKDARGAAIKVANAEIERFTPQPRSLMPELLLRDMTPQQVADLLEYLASLR
jgi:putative heme-binding domain-containing protein